MTQAQGTRENFTLIGKALFKDDTLVKDQVFKSGWTKTRLSMAVAVSQSNRPFVQLEEFGHYPEGHAKYKPQTVLKTFESGEGGKGWVAMQIPFAERFDKKHIDKVVRGKKIEVALVPELDAEGRVIGCTDNKEFLTELDAIAYVKANLKKDMRVVVYGETTYSRYINKENKVICKKDRAIKSIRLAKHDENNDSAGTTTFYIDEDSFDKDTFKEDKKYRVNGYQCSYVEKDSDGNAVNDIIPVEYIIDCNTLNLEDKTHLAMVDFLVNVFTDTKRGKIYKTTWRYKIFEGNEQTEVSVADLSDNLKQMVTLGFMTEEAALKTAQGGSYGDRISELKLVMPTGVEAKELMEDLTEDDMVSLDLENKASNVASTPAPKAEETKAATNEFDNFFGAQ